jgi:hypothetical protein
MRRADPYDLQIAIHAMPPSLRPVCIGTPKSLSYRITDRTKVPVYPENAPMRTNFAALLCLLPLALSAAPLDRKDVADNATWLLHADLAGLRQSALGNHLDALLRTPAVQQPFAAFRKLYGFDPLAELTGLTAYGSQAARPDAEPNGVAILRGRFDPTRLQKTAGALAEYQEQAHRAHRIASWTDAPGGRRQFGSVHAGRTVLLGHSLPEITQALDVLDGRGAGLSSRSPLHALLPQASGIVLQGASSNVGTAGLDGDNPIVAAAAGAKNATFGLRETEGMAQLEAFVTMAQPEAAQQLAEVVRSVVAVWTLAARDAWAIELARAVEITQNGPQCGLVMRAPVDQVAVWLQQPVRALLPVLP